MMENKQTAGSVIQMPRDHLSVLPRDTYIVILALKKRWRTIISVMVVVFTASVFYTVSQKRIFRSSATLQIEPNPPKPLGNQFQNIVDVGAGTYFTNKEYYATQHRLITSRAVAGQVVNVLKLNKDPRFVANTSPGQPTPKTAKEATSDDAIAILQGRLTVEPLKDSRLAIVTYDDADPERARKVLNAVVREYLDRNIERVVSSTSAASEWLHDQVGSLKTELENSELALHDYKKEKRLLSVSLNDQSNMLRAEMTQLNEALTQVRIKEQALKSREEELSKIDANDPVNLPSSVLLSNDLLGKLRQDYLDARATNLALQGEGKGENHPAVAASAARVESTRRGLLAEIHNVRASAKSDLTAIRREANGLSALLESAKQHAMDLNLLEIEYGRLERTKTNTEKLYGIVMERTKETDLTSLMRFNNLYLVEEPTLPKSPAKPRVPLNVAIGLGLSVVLGVLIGLAREVLDRRLHNPDEIESELGIACLGLLGEIGSTSATRKNLKRQHGRVRDAESPEFSLISNPTGQIAESARVIRTNIVFAAPDRQLKRLLVTSASPGEGKTMVATTIAITMAQTGQKVVLVDCDLRRARIHRVFGMTTEFGVSAAVIDPSLLDRHDISSRFPNLSVLTAGPRAANPAELLQSEAFRRLLDELAVRYDRIIIDSPPVAAVTDPIILATIADGIVFVAKWEKTSRELARRALKSLSDIGGRVLGCVLNGVITQRMGYGYYYGYSYKSGYYTDSESERSELS